MERLCPRDKLVFHDPLLLVGKQRSVLLRHLFAECLEPRSHQRSGGIRIEIMDRQLIQLAGEKPAFDRSRLSVRQKSLFRLDSQDPQCRLVARQGDRYVQTLAGRPLDQFFRRVAPSQAKRRVHHSLGTGETGQQHQKHATEEVSDGLGHAASFPRSVAHRKKRSPRGGFVLVEAMIALSILTLLGLCLLKLSLSILHPRQWILQQSLSDAYMTFERAYAERIPFNELTGPDSPWPASTVNGSNKVMLVNKSTSVATIGRLPGGAEVTGTVTRTRYPDAANDDPTSNPAAMQIWKVQSVLTYKVGNRSYAKSRTVIRAQ